MGKAYRVLLMVVGGILGGYFGYWLGHLAGWSTNAEWPFKIGGGTGAIAVSIGLAVVGVLIVGGLTRRRA
jgi:membrane protein YqaA with SNARE-associated domain